MATTLATFVSKIGFEVDKSSLKSLDNNLKLLENRISSLASKFAGITNNKTIAAAARLANAEARKINAELGLQNKKLQVARLEGQTEKLKQQTSLAGIRLETKKAGTEQIYARANAQTMIQKMKVGAAADMAAIKESLDSGMKLRKKQADDQALGRQILLMQKRNGFEESKLRRLQFTNQSQIHKAQMLGAQKNINSAQTVAELAQRAITKSTPYAGRSGGAGGISEGGRGRIGVGGGGLFGNVSVGAGLGGVAGGLAAQRFGEKAYRTGNFQIAQAPQFEFITGSAEEADKQVAFLNKEVDRLSLNLMDASAQYRQLLASTYKPLGIEQTQKLFTSVQNLSAMMGLSTDAQNRSFRALSQMASKSQVYSEELRGQLAESLPNAVGIFAEALFGGDTKKLFKEMEDGKVGLKEINKVIDYMATLTKEDLLAKMLESPARKMEKLRTSVTRMFIALNEGGVLDAMVFTLDKLADGVVLLTKGIKASIPFIKAFFAPIVKGLEGIWEYFAKPLLKLLGEFVKLIASIPYIGAAASGALLGLAASMTATTIASTPMMKVLKTLGLFFRRFALYPLIAATSVALFLQIIGALKGNENYFTKLTEDKNKGFLGWLGAIVRMLTETVELIGVVAFATGGLVFDLFKGNNAKEWSQGLNNYIDVVKSAYGKFGEVDAKTGMSAGIQQALGMGSSGIDYSSLIQGSIPNLLARPDSTASYAGNTYTNVFNITGTGLDPKQIADEVDRKLASRYNSAAANRSNLVMRPQ